MPKLVAIAALLIGGIGAAPAQLGDTARAPAAQHAAAPTAVDQRLDPQRKAWFDRAVGKILDGDTKAADPDTSRP